MDLNLTGRQPTFRSNVNKTNPNRALVLLALMIAALFLLRSVQTEQIRSPFLPTLIPTRTSASYALEGETHFQAGDLPKAIMAYQQAVKLDPNNAELWYELARIQGYSSTILTTDAQKAARLEEAMASIDKAVEIAPDNSNVHAIRAFLLDWSASNALVGDRAVNLLNEAEQEAVRALQIDNQNTLALAYYAEILIDELKFVQAEEYARQALERDDSLMDVNRIYGQVREALGYYGDAIQSYKKAIEITPNMTFLYVYVGANYRHLKQYDLALEYYAKAVTINEQLGVKDPIPYIAIGKTYSQMGEFFIASRNVEKALRYNPDNPDVYGALGIIYFRARNYEGSMLALKCAIYGCTAEESCEVRQCDSETEAPIVIEGMPLTDSTVVYYYTYGSVLSALHRPYNNYCEEALKVMGEVRAVYSNEPVAMSVVESSEAICQSFGYTRKR
jgi:tetratricopeptide (TPR) repeat protein